MRQQQRLILLTCTLTVAMIALGLTLPVATLQARAQGLAARLHLLNRVPALRAALMPAPMNYVVKNLNDSGPDSLRQAILDANANNGADTITFQAGLTGTITLTSGELLISDDVTITGPGARLLTVSGNNASRVFFLDFGVTATINDLTVAGGNGTNGGGILNQGTLTLNRSAVSGNTASFGGGGILNHPVATLTLRESTISGNISTKDGTGGGINNTGTLRVINSTISGNQANNSGIAGSNGGGIWSVVGSVTIVNSTISGNQAAGANSAGGLRIGSGSVKLKNTIVAGNTGTSGATADVNNQGGGTFTSQGYNLIGQNDGAAASFPAVNPNANQDIVGTSGAPINPLLGPLQNTAARPTRTAHCRAARRLTKGWRLLIRSPARPSPPTSAASCAHRTT